LKPDLNISVSYDQIFRQPLLISAPLGCINCHAGKLPYYRGRNVINWAIINNEPEIGLTVHYIDEGIDTGDIVVQRMLPIDWGDTYGSVLDKVQEACPDVLIEALQRITQRADHRLPQAHLAGTYFSRRIPGDEWLDWHDTSLHLYNMVRAITHPGPGARTVVNGRTLIIWRAFYDPRWPKYIATPGEVVGRIPGQGVQVKTGDSTLILESVQFDSTYESEYIPNFRIGTRFGVNVLATLHILQNKVAELQARLDKLTG
jgi:methionyl-tRNA formyltransferase